MAPTINISTDKHNLGITFSHPQLPTLALRLPPTEVDWSYNLLTYEQNTYAGQVVQVLGINFEKFTISGRFGRDGYGDYELGSNAQSGNAHYWQRKDPPTMTNSTGLTQMWTWFRNYMSIASQGVPKSKSPTNALIDNYNQQPVTITYQGGSDIPVDDNKNEMQWLVYPTNFPSFRIANDNFAPEWKVECEVYEAPRAITGHIMTEAIERLAYEPLYQPGNKWSDPYPVSPGDPKSKLDQNIYNAYENARKAADFFMQNLPGFPPQQIEKMIEQGFSNAIDPAGGQTTVQTPSTKQVQVPKLQGDPFGPEGGIVPDMSGINTGVGNGVDLLK